MFSTPTPHGRPIKPLGVYSGSFRHWSSVAQLIRGVAYPPVSTSPMLLESLPPAAEPGIYVHPKLGWRESWCGLTLSTPLSPSSSSSSSLHFAPPPSSTLSKPSPMPPEMGWVTYFVDELFLGFPLFGHMIGGVSHVSISCGKLLEQ